MGEIRYIQVGYCQECPYNDPKEDSCRCEVTGELINMSNLDVYTPFPESCPLNLED